MGLIIFIIIWLIIVAFIIIIAVSSRITKREIKTYQEEFKKRNRKQ